MKELLTRSASGISFVGIVLGSIWLHPLSLLFLLSLILVLGLNEFYNLCFKTGYHPLKLLGIAGSLALMIFNFYLAVGVIPERFLTLNLLIVIALPVIIMFYSPGSLLQTTATTLTGIIYVGIPLILLLHLNGSGNPVLISLFFIIIWIYDSLAYVTGRIAGKTRLAPKISPSKTWEGFLGGLILTVLLVWLSKDLNFYPDDIPWTILALVLIISATLGDLFESALKRKAGVKDSGSLIPGHGGILDRFDSVFFAAPVGFMFLSLIGNGYF